MSKQRYDPPPLRKVSEADMSYYFARDGVKQMQGVNNERRAMFPFLGTKTLLCRNCGNFVAEKDASQHDDWHRSKNFEDLYRRHVFGRRVA